MSKLALDRSKYWCGLSLDEFLPELFSRIDRYYTHVDGTGLLALWRASHKAAYSGYHMGGRIRDVGDNGKFQACEANEYRNLATHILNMICASKSEPEAQARNMDHESQQQTMVAKGLAETLSEDKGLEKLRQDVTERGLYYGEGWAIPMWNEDLGEVYHVDQAPVLRDGEPELDEEGRPKTQDLPIYAGDVEYHLAHACDVVRDVTRFTVDDSRWLCARGYANRYDLMALHPDVAGHIAELPSAIEDSRGNRRPRLVDYETASTLDSDDVAVWRFMHGKTPALPNGRIVTALSEELALEDDDLPYRELPHLRWSAADIEGLPFGYTLFYDLLALQQGINAGVSAIVTRMAAFGLPTVTGSATTKLESLGDGLAVLTYGVGENRPELIDFSEIPSGLVEFIRMLRELAATYSGINNVARGQPEGGITAASALALLEARAIQFVALSQKADITFMKRLYSKSLHHFQDFAKGEVLVRMTGKTNRTRVESYKRDAFDGVTGYTIKIGSALQSSTAGRLQLADGMKVAGVPMTPEQYIQVATTGRIDPIERGAQAELELIEAENEAITNGETPRADVGDNHPLHLRNHDVVGADPASRADPELMLRLNMHRQEHEQLWLRATVERPQMLAAKGIAPAPMPMAPPGMPPPGAPGAAPGGPPGEAAEAMPPPAPGAPPAKVNQARPAKNPVTGGENPRPEVSA